MPVPEVRRRGERAQLTRQAVADRALRVADAAGVDALTIRGLATELGVTPMALYWHFRSKDELLSEVTERVWAEIGTDVEDTVPWTEQLRGLLESLLRVLRAHPAAAHLMLRPPDGGQSCLPAAEATLGVLRNAGFDPHHASELARLALWTGIALVMSEPETGALPADSHYELGVSVFTAGVETLSSSLVERSCPSLR
jgi:AcrR family transcriptional regulator